MTDTLDRLKQALADRYAIEREIGSGGMATVYLAHDLKHGRQVAVKVLLPELAAILGGERFVNEIKVTANLQHPNILPLYDSGEAGSFLYYVMPLVEGESLRDKLDREHQLSVDEATKIAEAVAGALQYAHERGIVHRDIKPENILLQAGQALVADFGIALAVSQAGGSRLTETGLSLGTPHYMSPEQASGDRELDARSDVYSLGAMLYEMLAGEPPHLGNSVQAIIAKILTDHPQPISARRDTVPAHVDAALQVALAKLPADRFTTAAEFAQALANPHFTHATMASRLGVGATHATRWRRLAGVGAATSLLFAVVAALGWLRDTSRGDQSVVRFALPSLDSAGRAVVAGAVSPDGSALVLQVSGDDGDALIQRRLDNLSVTRLAVETQSATRPFFSPDGTQLGFISLTASGAALQIMPADGGPPRTVAQPVAALPASWGEDGFIYFTLPGFRLGRVPSAGGPIDTLFVPGTGGAGAPVALPGGRGVVFTTGTTIATLSMAVLDLRTGEQRVLARGGPYSAYLPTGHLLFARDRFLMAAPFDVDRMELTAEPVPIAEVPSGDFGWFAYGGGTLAYRGTTSSSLANEPVLLDRTGSLTRLSNLPGNQYYGYPAVSPDGRKIAMRVLSVGAPEEELDVWIYELPDGPLTRLTFEGRDDDPSWTPDGTHVLFDSDRSGRTALYLKPWDGSEPAELVLARDGNLWRTSWLPDGRRFVFYEEFPESGNRDLGLAVLGAPDSARLLFPNPTHNEDWPAVSRDGRWLAYVSNESGADEVYVRPLEGMGTRRQVSRQGGNSPVWAHSGRELFFVAGDSVYEAALDVSNDITVRSVRPLFALPCCAEVGIDVLPGDSLFLGFASEGDTNALDNQPVVVVHNFLAELRQRMGER